MPGPEVIQWEFQSDARPDADDRGTPNTVPAGAGVWSVTLPTAPAMAREQSTPPGWRVDLPVNPADLIRALHELRQQLLEHLFTD